jgi:hypothetical protein
MGATTNTVLTGLINSLEEEGGGDGGVRVCVRVRVTVM